MKMGILYTFLGQLSFLSGNRFGLSGVIITRDRLGSFCFILMGSRSQEIHTDPLSVRPMTKAGGTTFRTTCAKVVPLLLSIIPQQEFIMGWRPEIKVYDDPGFYPNGLTFATKEEALGWVSYKMATWMLAEDGRAVESDSPVNYQWSKEGGLMPM